MTKSKLKVANDQTIPVTILTEFLGSGKTTVLNRFADERRAFRTLP